MVFLGLILAAAAVTAATGVVMANDAASDLTVFGESVPLVASQWQVFLAGSAVAVVFMLGMIMIFSGLGRGLRNRRDLRYLRDEHEETMSSLENEKRRLQRELQMARKSGPPPEQPVPGRPVAGQATTTTAPRTMAPAARSPFFDR